MTAHALSDGRERCVDGGMDAYISKPIRAQELIQLIDSLSQGMTLSESCPEKAITAWLWSLTRSCWALSLYRLPIFSIMARSKSL